MEDVPPFEEMLASLRECQDNVASFALIYPDVVTSKTWGDKGTINKALINHIKQDTEELAASGTKIRLGGDINFTLSPEEGDWSIPYSRESLAEIEVLTKERAMFEDWVKTHYTQWLQGFRSRECDDKTQEAIDQYIIGRIRKFNFQECFMAMLQMEFYGEIEFNFPGTGLKKEEMQQLFARGFPTLIPKENATHDHHLHDYFDGITPELQIKPDNPLNTIERCHKILYFASNLADGLGYYEKPCVQHFHVSIDKDGKNLTSATPDPDRTSYRKHIDRGYHTILQTLADTFDHALPLLYFDASDVLQFGPETVRKNLNQRMSAQIVRVTPLKDTELFSPTIRVLDDRFEVRCATAERPHMALSVALITSSITKALKKIDPKTASEEADLPATISRYETEPPVLGYYLAMSPHFSDAPSSAWERSETGAKASEAVLGHSYLLPALDAAISSAHKADHKIKFPAQNGAHIPDAICHQLRPDTMIAGKNTWNLHDHEAMRTRFHQSGAPKLLEELLTSQLANDLIRKSGLSAPEAAQHRV